MKRYKHIQINTNINFSDSEKDLQWVLNQISIKGWEIVSLNETYHKNDGSTYYSIVVEAGVELLAKIDNLAKTVIYQNTKNSERLFQMVYGKLKGGDKEIEYMGIRYHFQDNPFSNISSEFVKDNNFSESEYIIKVVSDKEFKPEFYDAITSGGKLYMDYEKELDELLKIIE